MVGRGDDGGGEMMLATTMASKEEEGLEVLADEADLQVDTVVEAGKVVVGIMVEEGGQSS